MRTETIEIYKFEELSDSAKEKARNWYRAENREHGYSWDRENRETLQAFLGLFGATVSPGGFVRVNHDKDLSGLSLHKHLINCYYDDIFRPKTFWICGGRKNCVGVNSKARHSKIFVESVCPLTGYCVDDDILEPVIRFMKKPNKYTNFDDLLTECYESWACAVEKDHEYQDSDEYVDDSIIANGYEFTEDGEIY